MRKIIFTLIFVCHILTISHGNPVKKAGVFFEELVESLAPETVELNGSDEAVIVINLDSSESDYKEIPLAFLANSPNGESDSEDDDDDTKSNEDASVSAELLNPVVEIIYEPPKTTADESISDETGTCVETTPEVIDSDETGTCPITTTETPQDEDESESDETPKIIMKKTIITDDENSKSSSEEVDIIINPFLPVSDVAEIIKPKIEEEEEKLASDEFAYNLIDSNDIMRHDEDVNKTVKKEEQSFIQERFTRFINALMNTFVFA